MKYAFEKDRSDKKKIELPEKIPVKKEIVKMHVPIPRLRPTANDTSGPRPKYWPSEMSEALEELYQPSPLLYRSLEGEREEHQEHRQDPQERPWTLVELAIDAMQMPFQLDGEAKQYYTAGKDLPPPVSDRFQAILPIDVQIPRAIEAIEDGIFWKRLAKEKFPYMIPCPSVQKISYKSLFIQEWYSGYLSELEPYNFAYDDVIETTKMVAPFINILDIKELKAPIFRKKDPPRTDAEARLKGMEWLKETCLPAFPYVQRIDLSLVLPYLTNLTYLSICFGFSNYERYRCFKKSRINVKDIENLFNGILNSSKIVALRIYMSAIYETDMRIAVRSLLLFPVLLTKLEISSCELDDRAGRMIGQLILYHTMLEEIDIKKNYLTKTGAYFIAVALCKTRLRLLKIFNFSRNGIGCIGATYLALMLTVNKSLRSLSLSCCRIGRYGGVFLLKCLGLNKGLKSLDLSVNDIGNISLNLEIEIVKNMKEHPKLVDLVLANTGLDPALLELVKVTGNEKRNVVSMEEVSHEAVLVWKPKSLDQELNWRAYSLPENGSVCSTESGDLTSLGSTEPEVEEELEAEIIPRKKLRRFMKATLTERLVSKAIQTVLKQIHRFCVLRSQATGVQIKKLFFEELKVVPIKKLVNEEITRIIRRKMKMSKLFSEREKYDIMTPVPKNVINGIVKNRLNQLPRQIIAKVLNRTIKKVNC